MALEMLQVGSEQRGLRANDDIPRWRTYRFIFLWALL